MVYTKGRLRKQWGKKVPLRGAAKFNRRVGQYASAAAGGALGFIGGNIPGAIAGAKYGRYLYNRTYKRQRYARLASNRFTPRGPITGSNPGNVFGSNPDKPKRKGAFSTYTARKYNKFAHTKYIKF